MIRLVLDAMGGDHAPGAALDGVALGLERGDVAPGQVILTGPKAVLEAECAARNLSTDDVEICDAPDILSGEESPVDAVRKKPQNSIAVGVGLVKAGRADAFISAGNTGTVVATASMGLPRLKGIRRPGIAVTIEGEKGPFTVCDVGANPQPKALHLLHYGLMGAAYHRDRYAKLNGF